MDNVRPEFQINEEPLPVRPAGEPAPWDEWEDGRPFSDLWDDLADAAHGADSGIERLLRDLIEDVMDRFDEIIAELNTHYQAQALRQSAEEIDGV